MVGVNFYSRVFCGPEDNPTDMLTIAQAGLDKGGAAAYFGLGYTYRFRSPLGSAPFITLEWPRPGRRRARIARPVRAPSIAGIL